MESEFFRLPKFKITSLFFLKKKKGITDSFRQRYIYLLKLAQSPVIVVTPILVVNLGLFSIDKWNINKFVLCSLFFVRCIHVDCYFYVAEAIKSRKESLKLLLKLLHLDDLKVI